MKKQISFKATLFLLVIVVIAYCACWYRFVTDVAHGAVDQLPRVYFFDVGYGNAALFIFKSGAKVLVDAGPADKVIDGLETALGPDDRSIDLAIISDADAADLGGFSAVLERYDVGAFVYDGRDDAAAPSAATGRLALLAAIKARHIPLITLASGDSIFPDGDAREGSGRITILSPDVDFAKSPSDEETALVEMVDTGSFRTLLMSDAGGPIERRFLSRDIHVDILQAGEHGSNDASQQAFLARAAARIAVIGSGGSRKPGNDALSRLASATGGNVFRTDKDGTIEIWRVGTSLKVKDVGG